MLFNLKQKVGARFKLIAHKGDGIPVRETEWFQNLVLDTGLNRMSSGAWVDRCCVGSGNSTPVATQTQLDNFIASTTTKQDYSTLKNTTTMPYYYGAKITWRFGLGVAAGNLSEVGMGWGNSNLWNRALIKDINGNPTTITILSDEYLDVVSEIRIHPSEVASGSFNLNDKNGNLISTHTYIGKGFLAGSPNLSMGKVQALSFTCYTGSITGVGSYPSGSGGANAVDSIIDTYPTSRSCRSEFNLGLNYYNLSHKTLIFSYSGLLSVDTAMGYQIQINPPIVKTGTQSMKYTFELSWDRYTP